MSAYVPVDLQEQVRERFRNCCAYCRTPESLSISSFEFEHVLPRSKNGPTTLDNVCLACPMCNRTKACRETATDPTTQRRVRLFNPIRDQWDDHFQWNNDFTLIISETSIGRATIAVLQMNRTAMVRLRRMWVEFDEHPPVAFR